MHKERLIIIEIGPVLDGFLKYALNKLFIPPFLQVAQSTV